MILLLERAKQDAKLLTNVSMDFKTKQARLSALNSSGVEILDFERLQSEIYQLISTGKQVSERRKADKLAHQHLFQSVKELREHEEDLFQELLSQVQRRTINDCSECIGTGKVCTFSDDSEQCTECQRPPWRRCQGSVDDEDTDRIKAALETVDSQIDQILSHNLSTSNSYQSLKARLEQEYDAVAVFGDHLGMTSQELDNRIRLVLNMQKARKELEDFRKKSLIDDTKYQEIQIRRRILDICHSELLQRGVFYYDELEELAGYPGRRGYKSAEDMDHDEFREAVEWAADHPDDLPESPLLAAIQHEGPMDEEDADDSGIEV